MSATFYDTGYIHESRHVRSTCDFDIPLQVQIFVCKPLAACCFRFLPSFLFFSLLLLRYKVRDSLFLNPWNERLCSKNLEKTNYRLLLLFLIFNIFIIYRSIYNIVLVQNVSTGLRSDILS